MTKNELWKLYCERDKAFQKAREKRMCYTIIAFAIAYALLLYIQEKPDDFMGIAGILVFAIVLSVIHFIVNATIFGQLSNMSRAEDDTLKAIKKRMDEAE